MVAAARRCCWWRSGEFNSQKITSLYLPPAHTHGRVCGCVCVRMPTFSVEFSVWAHNVFFSPASDCLTRSAFPDQASMCACMLCVWSASRRSNMENVNVAARSCACYGACVSVCARLKKRQSEWCVYASGMRCCEEIFHQFLFWPVKHAPIVKIAERMLTFEVTNIKPGFYVPFIQQQETRAEQPF